MVSIPVKIDPEKLKQQAVDTVKRKAQAEAVSRISSPTRTGIAIAFEMLLTGGFVLGTVGLIAVMSFNPLEIAKSAIAGAVQSQVEDIPVVGNLVSNTSNAAAVSGEASLAGKKIAETALTWAGKDFNPGVSAQCAFFVRQVFADAGIDIGVAKGAAFSGSSYASAGFAGSFFSNEIGVEVPRKQLQPGDLVAFRDTYGNFPSGTITHVGIYVGDGMMVDRSTSSAPVNHRSVDHFGDKFMFGVRPHVYKGNSNG